MPEKGLTFFTANPFHNGHMDLIETALEQVDALDIYVGVRQKPFTLPHTVRVEALQKGLEIRGLTSRVAILTTVNEVRGSILNIGPQPYRLLAVGSDIATGLVSESTRMRDYERAHFLSFPALTVLEREGHPFTDATRRAILEKMGTVWMRPARTNISGTMMRATWKKGDDIRGFLPEGVWEVIEPHVGVFANDK